MIPPYTSEEDQFGETLWAIWEYLHGRFDDFELIAVDDGSRDGTSAVVEPFVREHPEARLISYQPNRGRATPYGSAGAGATRR